MPSDYVAFGQEIRALRERAGLSIAQVTERCHFSLTYVAKVEAGEILPHSVGVLDLAAALGAPFAALADLAAQTRHRRRVAQQLAAVRRQMEAA